MPKVKTPIRAWHFVGATLRDGRPVPKDGEKLTHPGEVVICKAGLHASREPFDALMHAPGDTLCLVECSGTVIERADKLVCSERVIVARMDATEMLRYFARMQALSVLDAARIAACSAAESATSRAARSAAWSAVWSAGRSAARSAARSATWSAARSATWSAARAEFNALVAECFEAYL